VTARDKDEVSELLPCPFCGGIPDVSKHFKHDMYGLVHRCPVIPYVVMEFAEKGYNEAKWNTRLRTSPLIEQQERLVADALEMTNQMASEIDAGRIEIKRLRKALNRYGKHYVHCFEHRALHRDHANDCLCGFPAALTPPEKTV
jgi:hypothetical protein